VITKPIASKNGIGRNLSSNLTIFRMSKSMNIRVAELDDACVIPERLKFY
jgi:hypothetical protein